MADTPPPAAPPVPPGQWKDPKFFQWKQAVVAGQGEDGKLHMFALEGGQWVKVL